MASYGDDATLTKIAVFGIAMSIFCTLGIQIMFVETGDYDYDEINAYRNDLINFSGESMINDNPWVLTHVYTPWVPGMTLDDPDNPHYSDGWLYGEDVISNYPDRYKSADIHMDVNQKSSAPLSFTRKAYDQPGVREWWTDIPVIGTVLMVGAAYAGIDVYSQHPLTLNNFNFTGYRYVLDPTLPFAENENTTSTRDGSLSLVWYSYNGQEGISGGLDIYGGRSGNYNDTIKLASYSATDIIADYDETSNYATVYDFDFEGTHLNLSIRFDANAIEGGMPLMQAWTEGKWSFAISSVSAGNFLDIDNSTSYATSMGSMLDTFIKIYTFNLPNFNNEWAAMMLWLMVGLPMTIALLCVTMRLMNAIKIL